MPLSLSVGRIFAVSMVAVGLMAGGCANQQKALESGVAGAPSPGSQQEFQVTVGDRVFFDTDSSDLSAQAQATLDRQIQWLTQYPQYTFTIEGHADERGTREYNLALGARRATAVRDFMIAHGIRGKPHAYDLLRQGAAGRRLRRHFLLVAEPPRRHGAR